MNQVKSRAFNTDVFVSYHEFTLLKIYGSLIFLVGWTNKNILTQKISQFTAVAVCGTGQDTCLQRCMTQEMEVYKMQISLTMKLQKIRATLHIYLFAEVNLHKLSKSAAVVVSHCFGIAK